VDNDWPDAEIQISKVVSVMDRILGLRGWRLGLGIRV
jgi:hypothetical protein